MRTQVGVLIGGVLFAWLVAAYPAWKLEGATGLMMSGASVLLCLVPAVVTFLWGLKALTGTPAERLQHTMLGTLLRMVVVLGGGMALYRGVPGFDRNSFWIWVGSFYLGTRALETVLLNLAPQARASGSTGQKAAGA